MSKAKWFILRKPSTDEIIAKSVNQIMLPKFHQRYKDVLYSSDPAFLFGGLRLGEKKH